MIRLKVGDKVKINSPSTATQPYNVGEKLVGKTGTVIWTKNFDGDNMQGICILLDDFGDLTFTDLCSAWSYYTGKEFTLLRVSPDYCKNCQLHNTFDKERQSNP